MEQITKYNSERDIAQVDQFGFVDILKSVKNGYVPGNSSSQPLIMDNCDDPSAIVGKPSDVFEAMRMQDSLINGISKESITNKGSSASDEN